MAPAPEPSDQERRHSTLWPLLAGWSLLIIVMNLHGATMHLMAAAGKAQQFALMLVIFTLGVVLLFVHGLRRACSVGVRVVFGLSLLLTAWLSLPLAADLLLRR